MKTSFLLLATLAASSLVALAADEKPAAPAKPKRDPAEIFKAFDINKDGSVTLEEYKIGMTGQMDPARIESVFKFKDKDGDGKLTVEELMIVPPKATPKPASKKEASAEKKAAAPAPAEKKP
jgi:Ca2+-binding EF-hand superfamily protein